MMKVEFEKLIGKEVDVDVFEMYNAMYMATDMNKYEFVKILNISAIPESKESQEAKEKTEELKKSILAKIEMLKAEIQQEKETIEYYIELAKDSVLCKWSVDTSKERIKRLKNQIDGLKLIIK